MRMYVLCVLAAIASASPALADSKSYCEIYAKDFASAKTSDVDEWQLTYRDSLKDCMEQYDNATTATIAPAVETPKPVVKKKVVAEKPAAAKQVVAAKKVAAVKQTQETVEAAAKAPDLVEGTDEWNAYCENKYASFNKETGTYKSHSGKERRCLVTP